jgi:hypothetical protein
MSSKQRRRFPLRYGFRDQQIVTDQITERSLYIEGSALPEGVLNLHRTNGGNLKVVLITSTPLNWDVLYYSFEDTPGDLPATPFT